MDHNDNTGCPKIIPPHSGYRDLKSYQMAEIIHGGNVVFCDRFIDRQPSYPPRTHDRMVQAARSGKQNIAEGWAGGWAMASGTSKKTELKLVAVARAGGGTACQVAHCLRRRAVGEWDAPPWGRSGRAAACFQDYLRRHGPPLWGKDDPRERQIRTLCYKANRSYLTPDQVPRIGSGAGSGRSMIPI